MMWCLLCWLNVYDVCMYVCMYVVVWCVESIYWVGCEAGLDSLDSWLTACLQQMNIMSRSSDVDALYQLAS